MRTKSHDYWEPEGLEYLMLKEIMNYSNSWNYVNSKISKKIYSEDSTSPEGEADVVNNFAMNADSSETCEASGSERK
jgi:hypothetical protein